MKTLRLVKFIPSQNVASRYWEEDGFRRNDTLNIADFTSEQQSIVAGAMDWAVANLPAGFESLESVELRRVADVVTEWSEEIPPTDSEDPSTGTPAQPLAYAPAFVASIVGNGSLGQSAIEINSVPSPAFNALAGLWDQLSV